MAAFQMPMEERAYCDALVIRIPANNFYGYLILKRLTISIGPENKCY